MKISKSSWQYKLIERTFPWSSRTPSSKMPKSDCQFIQQLVFSIVSRAVFELVVAISIAILIVLDVQVLYTWFYNFNNIGSIDFYPVQLDTFDDSALHSIIFAWAMLLFVFQTAAIMFALIAGGMLALASIIVIILHATGIIDKITEHQRNKEEKVASESKFCKKVEYIN